MRISVYCSSAPDIDPAHIELAYEIGKGIGERGWDLVWGGGSISMMGAVARGTRDHGGKTFGVIPTKLLKLEFEDKESTEIIEVDSMRTRKAKIEEMSDAFIALPGGIGTLEEFFEIWVGRYLGFHEKPIAVCDPSGAYAPLQVALDHLAKLNFMKTGQAHLVSWTTQVNEALDACARK
jgi:uncharacterized protein (TIGR00730 family)